MIENIEQVRKFLEKGIEPNDLIIFCYDNPKFLPFYRQLPPQPLTHEQRVGKLLDYALRHNLSLDPLLDWAKERNPPNVFAYYFEKEKDISTMPNTSKQIIGVIGLLVVIAIAIYFYITSVIVYKFNIKMNGQQNIPIPNAQIMLTLTELGSPIYKGRSTDNGLATITLPFSQIGRTARLQVEAVGYKNREDIINLEVDLLTDILLDPIPIPSPTSSPTNTFNSSSEFSTSPTNTNTLSPSPEPTTNTPSPTPPNTSTSESPNPSSTNTPILQSSTPSPIPVFSQPTPNPSQIPTANMVVNTPIPLETPPTITDTIELISVDDLPSDPIPNIANAEATFKWRGPALKEGQAFEVLIWGEGKEVKGAHDARDKQETFQDDYYQRKVNVATAPGVTESGIYNWSVALVELSPYKRLITATPQAIIISVPGNGGNNGGSPQATARNPNSTPNN